MEVGKVPENVLKRSVLKKIFNKRPEVVLGAGIGEDCAAVQLAEDEQFVISSDPITGTVEDIGKLAVQVTVNDLSAAGAEPIGILLTILLPEGTREIKLKQVMADVSAACTAANVQVMGGHTEVTKAVNQILLSVTGVGKVKAGRLISTAGAKAGMDFVITKWIGLEGTSIIAKEQEERLKEKLPVSLIRDAKNFDQLLSVQAEAAVAVEHGVKAMHDITEGGVFGALWEMSEASGVGCEIDLKKIPIKQETVEICEQFGLNPYKLISSGSMLMATEDGVGLVQALQQQGIHAVIVGKATDSNDRVILNDGERRFLEPPKVDELYNVH
ncbi:MAG: AIR synthase family protein [Lachnospiraceae bacterium]|nr:AIR synthase family protein [Lachnospiraceae bacterium]